MFYNYNVSHICVQEYRYIFFKVPLFYYYFFLNLFITIFEYYKFIDYRLSMLVHDWFYCNKIQRFL